MESKLEPNEAVLNLKPVWLENRRGPFPPPLSLEESSTQGEAGHLSCPGLRFSASLPCLPTSQGCPSSPWPLWGWGVPTRTVSQVLFFCAQVATLWTHLYSLFVNKKGMLSNGSPVCACAVESHADNRERSPKAPWTSARKPPRGAQRTSSRALPCSALQSRRLPQLT